jgi:hypothetical protein
MTEPPLLRGATQRQIVNVGVRSFGLDNMTNREERLLRFLEEALELVRAGGLKYDKALAVVEYEYGRTKGPDIEQEFGGAACTLFAAADAHDFDLLDCVSKEVRRVEEMPPGSAKKKHDGKPDSVKA